LLANLLKSLKPTFRLLRLRQRTIAKRLALLLANPGDFSLDLSDAIRCLKPLAVSAELPLRPLERRVLLNQLLDVG
jgi:hypothetical protein